MRCGDALRLAPFAALALWVSSGVAQPEGSGRFVPRKPAAADQTQKSSKDRGGNPCLTPDPGFGAYHRWDRSPSLGQMLVPVRGGLTKDGQFDVMIHFHGHEAVRKEWVQVMNGAVLVGIDLGIGSGAYSAAFASPDAFRRLLESVERGVAAKRGIPRARIRRLGLSAWSAGYGAVGEILAQPLGKQRVDVVVLLDGLHSGYQGDSLNALQLAPFTEFARRAARGDTFLFVSHSAIIPPGYASTTETASFLVHQVGGKLREERGSGPLGLEKTDSFKKKGFHVRGYRGNDKMDHCAHIPLFRDVLKVHVQKRWKTPKGWAPAARPEPEGRTGSRESARASREAMAPVARRDR